MKNLLHDLLDLIEHATGLAVSADPNETRTPADRVAELRDQVDALPGPAAASAAPAEAPATEPSEDPRDAKIAELEAQLAALQAPVPDPPAAAAATPSTEAPA